MTWWEVCTRMNTVSITCAVNGGMLLPIERDGRVGLCRAVEFHKVPLQNRLRLHGEIDMREI